MRLGRWLLRGMSRRPKPAPRRRRPARRLPAVMPTALPPAQELRPADLIRPDDSLRGNLEGFILDQRSDHTRRAYGKDLKRFVRFLVARAQGNATPERIDRRLLIAYKEQLLQDGLEHTTVDRHLATLRSFFRWLVDEGRIASNPAEGVRFLNPRRLSRTIGFTDEEVRRLLDVPDLHSRSGSMHYAVLMVLFYCGLRRSELCALTLSQLGEERGHRVLRLRGKGNVERVVVVPPPVWRALAHHFRINRLEPGAAPSAPVFPAARGTSLPRTGPARPIHPSLVFYIVTRYARRAGIASRVSPHSCRATAISNARDRGVSDRAIQDFAGWASPDMITRYDKRRTSVEKSAALAIRYGDDERSRLDAPTPKTDANSKP